MKWLIEESAFNQLKAAHKAIENGASHEDVSAFLFMMPQKDQVNLLSVVDGVAKIDIKGVLRNESNPYWGTGYSDIIDAIDAAESDSTVKSIDFIIDSPGGMVSGLFDVTDMIAATSKPTRALVGSLAASAAYAIASQADEIIATSRAATFGSIGIVQTFYIWEDEVTVTSTNAPNKASNPTTKSGKAEITRHLDELHDLFVDAISNGRGTDAENINENYGKGGVFLAKEALERGMIDKLEELTQTVSKESRALDKKALGVINLNNIKENHQEAKIMDLQTLKAEHPEVYRQAVMVGVDTGVAQERDRVSAHLTYGEASGSLDVATKAIKEGSDITEALRAQYITAGMNRQNLTQMANDNPGVSPDQKPSAETDKEAGINAVFEQVNELIGLKG